MPYRPISGWPAFSPEETVRPYFLGWVSLVRFSDRKWFFRVSMFPNQPTECPSTDLRYSRSNFVVSDGLSLCCSARRTTQLPGSRPMGRTCTDTAPPHHNPTPTLSQHPRPAPMKMLLLLLAAPALTAAQICTTDDIDCAISPHQQTCTWNPPPSSGLSAQSDCVGLTGVNTDPGCLQGQCSGHPACPSDSFECDWNMETSSCQGAPSWEGLACACEGQTCEGQTCACACGDMLCDGDTNQCGEPGGSGGNGCYQGREATCDVEGTMSDDCRACCAWHP